MTFSRTSLALLQQLTEGRKTISEIAAALRRSPQQVRREAHRLQQAGLIELRRGQVIPRKTSFTNLLLRLFSSYPNLIPLLADSGLALLAVLLAPKTVQDIVAATGLKKSIIYRQLQQAQQLSIVKKERKRYHLNTEIWPELAEFFQEWILLEKTVDWRVPTDAVIYLKNRQEIVFSTKEEMAATKTAFSAYQKYGLKLLLPREYYLFPSRKVSKREIFIHSLAVTEKEKTARHLVFLAVFYQKHRKDLSRITHPLLQNIKEILQGKSVRGYPSLAEIKEKMEVYQ